MSDPSRQEDIENFIRKSLLGVELVDTQFHLFSAKSVSSGRVANPRVLTANDVLLTKNSTYFSELLSSPTRPSDPALVDIGSIDRVPKSTQIDDYGYGSDSDLDDDDDALTSSTRNGNPAVVTQPKISPHNSSETKLVKKDEESSDADSEPFASDILLSKPRIGIRSPEPSLGRREEPSPGIVPRLRAISSRHILVKDTAFQTWYTLLHYLYTGKINFLPLKSAGMQSRASSTNPIDEPRCSPKSMYRLACKVGMDGLRDEAMAAISSGLTEHNILTEIAHSLVSRHTPLLEMELDVLYSHIASAPVVTGLPDLARRIANKEIPHGADIIGGFHSRLIQQHVSSPPLAPPLDLAQSRSATPEHRSVHSSPLPGPSTDLAAAQSLPPPPPPPPPTLGSWLALKQPATAPVDGMSKQEEPDGDAEGLVSETRRKMGGLKSAKSRTRRINM